MDTFKFYSRIFLAFTLIILTVSMVSCSYNNEAEDVNITPTATPYISVGGEQIPLDIEELDLSDSDIGDISALSQLQNLTKLDLQGNDIPPEDIAALQEALPECDIKYSIKIGETEVYSTAKEINLSDIDYGDVEQIIQGLNYLPDIDIVNLGSSEITIYDYKKISNEFPDITFEMDLLGITYDTKETDIDLTGVADVDEEELMDGLYYFSDLSVVDFGKKSFPEPFMDSLMAAFPDVLFIWDVNIYDKTLSSTDSEVIFDGYIIDDYPSFKNSLKYLPGLKYIDMCKCRISDDKMKDLADTYPDIKFVWIVTIGNWEVRTDAKAFSTGKPKPSEYQDFYGDTNRISNEDAANFAYFTDLIALDIGHQGAVHDFTFLESLPDLKYLIVAMTGVEDDDISSFTGLKKLEYMEIFSTKLADFTFLTELPMLYHLNLSLTKIDNIDTLKQMKQLQNLWYDSRDLNDEQIDELRQELPDCRIVDSRGNPTREGWRSTDNQNYIDMMEIFGMRPIFSK